MREQISSFEQCTDVGIYARQHSPRELIFHVRYLKPLGADKAGGIGKTSSRDIVD